MSLEVKTQSNASVFPFAISWVSESTASLTSTVPGLTESIADLQNHGLAIQLPDGVFHLPVRIDIAADMSSLWKLNGIGSASTNKSCVYCNASTESRQHIGDPRCNLNDPENVRTDLRPIFGLPLEQIHICTLHGMTRVTEKLVKLVAVHCVASHKRHVVAIDEAKTTVKNAQEAVRLAELLSRGCGGRGRGRGRGTGHSQPGQPSLSVEDAKIRLAHATMVHNALVATSRSHGSTVAMGEAIVATGVLQKTFNITVTPHVRGDGATIVISSFTGTQAQKLLGCYSKPDETPPYVRVVEAAYGGCLHLNSNSTEDGLLDPVFCIVCNAKFLFRVFGSQLLPVLQAVSVSDLTTTFQKAFPGKPAFCEATFHSRFQYWGAVLVHTFYGGGSRSLISDYCKLLGAGALYHISNFPPVHLLIEHSAYLIATRGPLGFWSQQSMEASHKVTKDVFRRGTNHDGRRKGGSSAPFQIILRQGRILVGAARCATLDESSSTPAPRASTTTASTTTTTTGGTYSDQLVSIARGVFALSPEEREYCDYANDKVVNRVKRSLADIAAQGAHKKRRLDDCGSSSSAHTVSSSRSGEGSGEDDTTFSDSDTDGDDDSIEEAFQQAPAQNSHSTLAAFLNNDVFDDDLGAEVTTECQV